jgi:hypothetical protein
MITKELYPEISEESIQQALETGPGKEYPESVLNKKIEVETKTKKRKGLASIILALFVPFAGFSLIYSFFKPGFLSLYDTGDRITLGSFFLIGIVTLLALNRQSKKVPQPIEKGCEKFYYNLPSLFPYGNSFQSYLILAPSTMKDYRRMNLKLFGTKWMKK